jgi:3-hydroxyacyl-[acyl-carrier-protein] dehydratase
MDSTLHIPTEHPAFEGHFPGAPLLPGVVLLDEILRALEAPVHAKDGRGWIISTAKFLQPVRPGETLTLEHESLPSGAVRFTIRSAGRPVATGTLTPRPAAHEPDHGHETG